MLRPALLLPPKRDLTSSFSRTHLWLRCGPATRRSGAYRDGTLTRWRSAARPLSKQSHLPGIVTAHHDSRVYQD